MARKLNPDTLTAYDNPVIMVVWYRSEADYYGPFANSFEAERFRRHNRPEADNWQIHKLQHEVK